MPRKIDWVEKLQNALQALAFSLAVSAIQHYFQPDRSYALPLVYSLCIGSSIWALIDLGRELFPSSEATGWPQGWLGLALPLGAIVGGYAMGTWAADRWFGWSSWDAHPYARAQLPVSIIVTALAGLTATYYFYSKSKTQWLARQAETASRQAAESKLKLLEAQIEPHMLFNTLANLRALIGVDSARALTMLDHLNGYLRSTLQASRTSMHPLADEFARIGDYLELMAVRMGPRLIFEIDLPPALAQLPVPPLILQPLVENAIVHGLEPSVPGGRIRISAQIRGGALHLQVADTGLGLGAQVPRGSTSGFGLSQVRERLHTLYGDDARLELVATDQAGGGVRWTCSDVTIPASV